MTRSTRFQAVGSTYGLFLPFKCRVACLMRSMSLLYRLLSSLDCPLSIIGHNNQDESGIHRIAACESEGGAPPLQGGSYVAFKAPDCIAVVHIRLTRLRLSSTHI